MRPVGAERRKTEIEVGLAGENWHDPVEGRSVCMSGLSHEWVEHWLPTRHDLPATNWGRLETTVPKQSGPASAPRRFLRSRTSASDNGSPISASGLSAATDPEVFGCRDRRQSSAVQSGDRGSAPHGATEANALLSQA
jgi:hypothetical protein